MPNRLPTECRAGCHRTTTDRSGYCELHRNTQVNARRAADKDRYKNNPWRAWYGRVAWLNLRDWFLHQPENAICAWVDDQGVRCTQPASECDHRVPHRGEWALFINQANLQGLCKSHHSEKTAREDGGFGRSNNG
jgi:5-methylcytosine-specific restriction protein A